MTKEQELSALNKIINSMDVYPSVDEIKVSLNKDESFLIYKLYLNEPVTKEEIYDSVDVFWLIDHHVKDYFTKLIPFDKIPILNEDYQVEVYNSNGVKIFDWLEDLQVMHGNNPNSMGGTQWYRMSKGI
jgi:hypothetical protein